MKNSSSSMQSSCHNTANKMFVVQIIRLQNFLKDPLKSSDSQFSQRPKFIIRLQFFSEDPFIIRSPILLKTHIHHQIVIFSQRPINCQLPNFLKRPTFIIRLYFFLKDPLIKRFPIFSQDSLSSYQHAAKLLKSKHCEKINSKLKS